MTAGCASDTDEAPTASPTNTNYHETTPPDDLPEWTPTWTEPFGNWTVLGLNAAHGRLYATLQANPLDGPAAVAAVDPADGSVLWRRESEGEPVRGSHAGYQRIARSHHGLTPSDDTIYTVAGRADSYEWTALHALEPTTGERRWSLQRERALAVAGMTGGLVIATGREFFEPEHSHDSPDEPLTTIVYGLETPTGEVRWTRRFEGVRDVSTSPDGVYVAAGDRLTGLGKDGSTLFTYDRGLARRVEAIAGRIYYLTAGDETGSLHGVAPSGDTDWTRDLPVRQLLLDGDRLYAAGDATVAVEPDGTVVWRHDDHGRWLLVDPDGDTVYTRSGTSADRTTAYRSDGRKLWTFTPPSDDAWPEAATDGALAATAIDADERTFKTIYSVDDNGHATASLGRGTVFDGLGLDGTIYLADGSSELLALPA